MSTLAFTLIVTSAVMHALWNLLVKQCCHKTVFIWLMFVASTLLFSLTLPLVPERFHWPGPHTLLMAGIGSSCFVLYHLLNGRAYRSGDLSVIYPLSQTSIIYVPLWGMLFLGERLSLSGCAGIFLVILGTYSVQLQRVSLADMSRPFRDLNNPAVRASLAAGFIYSIGSVAEKNGVKHYPPVYFTFVLVMMMVILMSINICREKYRGLIVDELRKNWRLVLYSGPVVMASFLTFRYGLNMAPVSYAVPVRQVSIMVGVVVGVLFLGEACGKIRLASALLIVCGAILIRLG